MVAGLALASAEFVRDMRLGLRSLRRERLFAASAARVTQSLLYETAAVSASSYSAAAAVVLLVAAIAAALPAVRAARVSPMTALRDY